MSDLNACTMVKSYAVASWVNMLQAGS